MNEEIKKDAVEIPKGKRTYFRLSDCIQCRYRYTFLKEDREGLAKVFDVSAGGAQLLASEYIGKDKVLELDIEPPLGPLKLQGKVLRSQVDWFITDRSKEKFCKIHVQFEGIELNQRNQIIKYVYKCRAERRIARLKGRSEEGYIDSGWKEAV